MVVFRQKGAVFSRSRPLLPFLVALSFARAKDKMMKRGTVFLALLAVIMCGLAVAVQPAQARKVLGGRQLSGVSFLFPHSAVSLRAFDAASPPLCPPLRAPAFAFASRAASLRPHWTDSSDSDSCDLAGWFCSLAFARAA